ncbi:hypothetical protein MNBD_GAMMA02-1112, partial [hydrothermal vent metagenome]
HLLSGVALHILVPASWVYHTQTHVASKNTELLAKSIPFAIEEELSNEVEDNYYAFRLNEDGSQYVIAIEKVHLNQLNDQIESHHLDVEAIHSEVDWLPAQPTEVSIWSDAGTALLKLGQDQAMRVANSQINQLLAVFGQDKQQIICNEAAVIDYADLPIKNNLTAADCCRYLLSQNAINLYIDEIKTKQSESNSGSRGVLKMLLGLLIVSWFLVQGIQWYALQQSIADIKQLQKELFTQNYPNAAPSELVDPFAALQSRLKIKNAPSTQNQSMLIVAIDKLGQTLKQQQSVKLNGLRLVDQKMELQIVAPNMTVINDFHQLLQQYASDYSVQIGVNELGDDNTFKSILTMVPR